MKRYLKQYCKFLIERFYWGLEHDYEATTYKMTPEIEEHIRIGVTMNLDDELLSYSIYSNFRAVITCKEIGDTRRKLLEA
jgi:hypothetical protein